MNGTTYIIKTKITGNIEKSQYELLDANVIHIKELEDFPTPSGGKITLTDNMVYYISSSINIGTDYIVVGDNTKLEGSSAFSSQIIYTGVGAAIRGIDTTVSIANITFIANNAAGKVFDFINAAKTKNFVLKNSVIAASTECGKISGYKNVAIDFMNHTGNSDGWEFVDNQHLFFLDCFFDTTNSGTFVDVPTGVFDDIIISRCNFDVSLGATGIDIDAATIVIGNGINIFSNVFAGNGTYTTGFDISDLSVNVKMNEGVSNFVAAGSMYWEDVSGTMTLGAPMGWKKIQGNVSLSAGLKRFTHTSPNKLTYNGDQTIHANVSVSLATYFATGGAFIAAIGVAKNGVVVTGSQSGFTIYGADEPCATNLQLELAKDDYIEVFIKKFIGGSTNIVVSFLNVQINELS